MVYGAEVEFLEAEVAILESLRQSERRKEWLADAFACALNLPQGAVRDAINRSPGVALSLRLRRASVLLKETDVEEIYDEFGTDQESPWARFGGYASTGGGLVVR